jgi:hypothetical protein
LLWLVSAAEVDSLLVEAAKRAANDKKKLASKSAAIRKQIPWAVVSAALHRKLQTSAA